MWSVNGKTSLASGWKDGDHLWALQADSSLHPSQLHTHLALWEYMYSLMLLYTSFQVKKIILTPQNRPYLDSALSSSHRHLSVPYSAADPVLGSRNSFTYSFLVIRDGLVPQDDLLNSEENFPGVLCYRSIEGLCNDLVL